MPEIVCEGTLTERQKVVPKEVSVNCLLTAQKKKDPPVENKRFGCTSLEIPT